MHFRDRTEAGQLLAERLKSFAGQEDALVLALPRGGVPVGHEVARALGVPLDIFVVRKLGFPGHPELAMGAIASGGVRVLNQEVVAGLNVPEEVIDRATAAEKAELERRERVYRGERPAPAIEGRTVIVVDDGVATGSTMRAAILALRQADAARIVVATPTIASETSEELREVADEVVAVITPYDFCGVGQWYDDFAQTSDAEVRAIMGVGTNFS